MRRGALPRGGAPRADAGSHRAPALPAGAFRPILSCNFFATDDGARLLFELFQLAGRKIVSRAD